MSNFNQLRVSLASLYGSYGAATPVVAVARAKKIMTTIKEFIEKINLFKKGKEFTKIFNIVKYSSDLNSNYYQNAKGFIDNVTEIVELHAKIETLKQSIIENDNDANDKSEIH